jgi:hypothetical protein
MSRSFTVPTGASVDGGADSVVLVLVDEGLVDEGVALDDGWAALGEQATVAHRTVAIDTNAMTRCVRHHTSDD